MDAVGVIVGAAGAFLLYAAYKNLSPAALFRQAIGANATGSTGSAAASKTNAQTGAVPGKSVGLAGVSN